MSESRTAVPVTGATSSTSKLDYILRAGGKSDWPMVADAWVNSHRASSRATKLSNKATFFRHHHRIVDLLLQSPGVRVIVAAPADDDFTAYGFAVVQGSLVHMVYVKAPFRRIGVAKTMLAGFRPSGFTHWTKDIGQWIYDKYPGLNYDPFWMEAP
jgi:hypothetical protein